MNASYFKREKVLISKVLNKWKKMNVKRKKVLSRNGCLKAGWHLERKEGKKVEDSYFKRKKVQISNVLNMWKKRGVKRKWIQLRKSCLEGKKKLVLAFLRGIKFNYPKF